MFYDNLDLERRRGEVERHRENSARLAVVYGRYETTGQGTYYFEDQVPFGLTFIEEPFMAYGSQLDVDALKDLLELDDDTDPPLPICSGTVVEWDQDERDFYVGAWVAVTVTFPAYGEIVVPADMLAVVRHHFTFQAIAIKDVPIDIRD